MSEIEAHKELRDVILFLRPNAKFILRGLNIEWLDDEQTEPTSQEIEQGYSAYSLAQETVIAEAEVKRQSALAKLEALGLDEDDLKALGL